MGPDELKDLSEELLRAIEAEPVPEPIQVLARRLACALGSQMVGDPVLLAPREAVNEGDS
ncbi:hypothetical protein [Cereibacter sediminicola]|uniref:hypothetical protein n=1 Tax=Cereibacter sediminicola TaxID=2584941 RepID=UPI001FEAB7F0|nr:hypothetical protein [Cereibacter sediminicola]